MTLQGILHRVVVNLLLLSPLMLSLQLRLDNKDAAHQLLVQYNLRLLAKIARKYRGRGMDIEDLIVEGARGLARAIEGYDPTKGNRFSTYAYNWISQSVGRCISEESRVVRLPMHVLEVIHTVPFRLARSLINRLV